jgi:hypothetical protein
MNSELKRKYLSQGGGTKNLVQNMMLIEAYGEYLEKFKQKALIKFIKGRIEHSDQDPKELDIQKEIENKLFDIKAYNYLKLCN